MRATRASALLCRGDVVHKRLRPKLHALRYRVFSLLIDVDRIDEAVRDCRWLSHNRFNAISIYDRDFGRRDARALGDDVRDAFVQAGHDVSGCRVLLLAYPRLLGFAFNPLAVFFLMDATDQMRALIYEVSNTFGERKRYVLSAGPNRGGVYAQTTKKELFVSPFTPSVGHYSFRAALDDEHVVVAVLLRDFAGPLIKTHFSAVPEPLTSNAAFKAAIAFPLMSLKVVAGIHWEAAKLWVKGVPLVRRHRSPRYSISYQPPVDGQAAESLAPKVPHV